MQIPECQVTAAIRKYGPRKTLDSFLLVNNAKIMSSADAWDIVHERATIVDALMKDWIMKIVRETLHDDPVASGVFPFNFAFLAVGGYGRSEMNPNSDIDIRLIVDDTKLQENPLVQKYKDEMYDGIVRKERGLAPDFIVHNLHDLQGFTGAELNHFLDMRLLYGNRDLLDVCQRTLKERCDPSELFLHHVKFLEGLRQKYPQSFDDAEGFNVKFGIGGLRQFHTSVWIEAAETFSSCREIYARAEIPESVYDAAGILLKMRSWLNLRREKSDRPCKTHAAAADTFTLEDMRALTPVSLERLLFARREINRFAESKMKEKLKKGIRLGPEIVFGYDGLLIDGRTLEMNSTQRNDLFFSLHHTAYRRGLPISPIMYTTFCKDAAQWVRPHPLFVRLLYDGGSLSDALKELAGNHCLGKLIPGFSALEASLHEPGHRAEQLTRAGFAMQKIAVLETLVGEQSPIQHLGQEYKALSPDYAAAVKLTLLIKHLPRSERIAGLHPDSLSEYLQRFHEMYPSLPDDALDTAGFLIRNHDLFNRFVVGNLNDASTVRRFKKSTESKERLRALYLFTHADHGLLAKSNIHYWNDVEELYQKTMRHFLGNASKAAYDPMALDEEGRAIAEDLGPDFMSGRYAHSAMSWISYLKMVHKTRTPIIRPYSNQEHMIGIACPDYPGLLAAITGTFYDAGANVNRAHAYSLSKHGLALDMFDFTPGSVPAEEIMKQLQENIMYKRHTAHNPFAILASLKKSACVEYRKSSGYYALSFTAEEDRPGIMYALTSILHEKLGADIYGLSAYASKERPVNDFVFFKTEIKPAETVVLVKKYLT